ncbi:hypothetical protein [Iodobacter fluviatilis]|uniref:Uncharacterized protein n=1 Tax=Iodobacter fluviatilis TaxID=537 RepID=A0A377SUP4_9NEIS|nr:hypothetical protein [Iodobacter fluviatilis]TCU85502.1 hypothetical protein EV682_10712 [Iodobacter fluviatilis]STR45050.1 Uncharacterised protein [Iodobacter fluviatilis]
MLGNVCAEDFLPLLGKVCYFKTEHLAPVAMQIDAVTMRPETKLPSYLNSERLPFMVELSSAGAINMIDATGTLALPAEETEADKQLHSVWIGRVAPLGRDPTLAYFQLLFN